MISLQAYSKNSVHSRSTIDKRIRKLKIKTTLGNFPKAGRRLVYISLADADRIEHYIKPGKWTHYIKSTEIAAEMGISSRDLQLLADAYGIPTVSARRTPKDSPCKLYSPKQYEMVTGRCNVVVIERSESSGTKSDNRPRGLYNRITDYGGLLDWEK